ncbi:MAG: DUF3180 domain-containing protein [Mycobacterium sp.]
MGLTRKRDLLVAAVLAAVVVYVLVTLLYRYFPPLTLWTGISLVVVAVAEALWGGVVRARIDEGHIGVGPGMLDPLVVARSVVIAKASAWVGAIALGGWLGVLGYLLPRRSEMRVAADDTAGAVAAALCALALVAAGLWLQHCCRSPNDPPSHADGAVE